MSDVRHTLSVVAKNAPIINRDVVALESELEIAA